MLNSVLLERCNSSGRLMVKPRKVGSFTFCIGGVDATRARSAIYYALIEYLIDFRLPLCHPVIIVDPRGLRARVERKGFDEAYYTPSPQELECTQYLKSEWPTWGVWGEEKDQEEYCNPGRSPVLKP